MWKWEEMIIWEKKLKKKNYWNRKETTGKNIQLMMTLYKKVTNHKKTVKMINRSKIMEVFGNECLSFSELITQVKLFIFFFSKMRDFFCLKNYNNELCFISQSMKYKFNSF